MTHRVRSRELLLFLDTPRAANGLNHRFFVGAPENLEEKEIHRYSKAARASTTGPDYIAASRPVTQVTNGQVREALELLVLGGVSTQDEPRSDALRQRLKEMLESLPDAPVAVAGHSAGMLIANPRIEAFERELRTKIIRETPEPIISSPMTKPSKPTDRFKLFAALSAMAVLLIALIMLNMSRHPGSSREDPPAGDSDGQVTDQSSSHIEDASGNETDWSFLHDDPDWKALGNLTGLPKNWDQAAAKIWANNLLSEADLYGSGGRVLLVNDNMLKLLGAVRESSQTNASFDAVKVSRIWMKNLGNDANGLDDFWAALKGQPEKEVSPVRLKKILASWTKAYLDLRHGAPDVTEQESELLSLVKSNQSPEGIQILVEADLKKFVVLKTYLGGDEFYAAVKNTFPGKNFKALEWPDKLKAIKELGTNPDIDDSIKKFCASLSRAYPPALNQPRP